MFLMKNIIIPLQKVKHFTNHKNMLAVKKSKVLTLTLVSLIGLSACVDNNYNLADVDTDEIVIGDTVVAPLGKGSIEASKLLDTKSVKEISTDENGNYIVSYGDELKIKMPDITLDRVKVEIADILIPSDIPSMQKLPQTTISLSQTHGNLTFKLPAEIRQLDSVIFVDNTNAAVFTLTVRAQNFSLLAGNADVKLEVNFPQEYKLVSLDKNLYSLTDNKLTCNVSLRELSQGINIPIKIKSAVNGGSIKINTVIDITEDGTIIEKGTNAALTLSGVLTNLDYEAVYGAFNINFDVNPGHINMGDFSDIFEGDHNVLSFTDPHLKLITLSNIGIPLQATLDMSATNKEGKSESTIIKDINVLPAMEPGMEKYNKIWIGAEDTQDQYKSGDTDVPGMKYSFISNTKLNDIIKISPTQVTFSMNVVTPATSTPQFFTKDAKANVKYTVEIPFKAAADFKSNVSEMIEDAFDSDLIDYVFTDGSVTISGDIINTVPLNISMNLEIVDAQGSPVGIDFTPQEVRGSKTGQAVVQGVSYTIREADMPKMKNARDIKVLLTISSDAELAGIYVNEKQKIDLNLKLLKTGGITINND